MPWAALLGGLLYMVCLSAYLLVGLIQSVRIRDSEDKFRKLIEGSIQGMWLHRNFKLVFVNQALADMFGHESPGEVLSLGTARKLIAPEHWEMRKKRGIARLQGKQVTSQHQFQGRRKDGSLIWLDAISQKVTWEGAPAIQTTVIDITERKNAEQRIEETLAQLDETQLQLVQAGKLAAMGQLAAGIAHEINHPLATIASSAEMFTGLSVDITTGKFPTDLMKKHLDKINNNVFRSKSIINNMLNFARNDEISMESVDVRELLRETIKLAQDTSQSNQGVFTLHSDGGHGLRSKAGRMGGSCCAQWRANSSRCT